MSDAITRRRHPSRLRSVPDATGDPARLDLPLTNKVLLEGERHPSRRALGQHALQTKDFSTDPAMVAVTDQAANVPGLDVVANLNYRARGGANANNNSWNKTCTTGSTCPTSPVRTPSSWA